MPEPFTFPVLYLAPWTLNIGDSVQIMDIRLDAEGSFRVWIEFSGQVWAWSDTGTPVLVTVRHRWELETITTGWAVARRADGRPAAVAHSAVMEPSQPPGDTPTAASSRPAAAVDGDGTPLPGMGAYSCSRSPTADGDLEQ